MNQANFCISLQNSRGEIELCANILTLHCDKNIKDRELIFCSKVSLYKFFKTQYSLKKHTDFELLHVQNPYFYFFANVPTNPKDITKYKNKG